jgi:hypothetical protein
LAETVSFGGPFGENDAQATLFAPSGAQLGMFDSTVQQRFTLAESGAYVIKVNANTLLNTGSYNLGLERLKPLGPIDGTLSCGNTVARSITQQGEVQLFTFAAGTNAQVTISLVETVSFGGPFGENDARATLFGPSGAQLAFLDSDSQQQFTLGESGTYIIQVNANTLLHTGSYDLSLVCP